MSSVEVLDLAGCSFRAMGTDVEVLVLEGCDGDLHWARAEVERFEDLWSRFRPGSELERINAQPGRWASASSDTLELLEAAAAARRRTAGAFDPLLGDALARAGYDRSFEAVDRRRAGLASAALGARRSTGAELDLDVDRPGGAARIPVGTRLDLGGIAKGWTADRLVAGLLERGAHGACVNLGGDVAVGGRAPHPDGWSIEVGHQSAAPGPTRVAVLYHGGVATSTTLRRAWHGPEGDARHHLLDPRTGRSCAGSLVEATVVADSAAEAEVLTKVAFADPSRLGRLLESGGAGAVLTTGDGTTTEVGDLRHLRHLDGTAR
ncbi:MAG: FAD:protein FMN transferase [Acidimicrobiales bacterium]